MSSQHIPVRISSITPNRPIPFDLFVLIRERMVLYVRAGDALTEDRLSQFTGPLSTGKFFIPANQRPQYKAFINDQMNASDINQSQKALILRESAMVLVEELYTNPDVDRALKESRGMIQSFVQFMSSYPEGMADLIGLSGHDFYTFQHSLDVAIYSLGLGALLGYKGAELEELGRGALFHDIGKRNISLDILCKAGALTEDEWATMQKHPEFGLLILNESPVITGEVKAACFEHHESVSGGGYPQGISGDEIHPYAKIVAICDTYDAMTTQRTYNSPLMPAEALELMSGRLLKRFDKDMMKAMTSVLFSATGQAPMKAIKKAS